MSPTSPLNHSSKQTCSLASREVGCAQMHPVRKDIGTDPNQPKALRVAEFVALGFIAWVLGFRFMWGFLNLCAPFWCYNGVLLCTGTTMQGRGFRALRFRVYVFRGFFGDDSVELGIPASPNLVALTIEKVPNLVALTIEKVPYVRAASFTDIYVNRWL